MRFRPPPSPLNREDAGAKSRGDEERGRLEVRFRAFAIFPPTAKRPTSEVEETKREAGRDVKPSSSVQCPSLFHLARDIDFPDSSAILGLRHLPSDRKEADAGGDEERGHQKQCDFGPPPSSLRPQRGRRWRRR